MYNRNNVHVNGTQNLSLVVVSQSRQNCNYNKTLLFVPFSPPRHSCPHHFPVRYMGHGYPLNSCGEGVRNQAGFLPSTPSIAGTENGSWGEVPTLRWIRRSGVLILGWNLRTKANGTRSAFYVSKKLNTHCVVVYYVNVKNTNSFVMRSV